MFSKTAETPVSLGQQTLAKDLRRKNWAIPAPTVGASSVKWQLPRRLHGIQILQRLPELLGLKLSSLSLMGSEDNW